MTLSPREHHTLREITERLVASDPHLVRLLRHGPAAAHHAATRREVLAWRLLAGLLFTAAYVVAEWGLIRAGAAVATDGALLALVALAALGWAGHRARCIPCVHL